MKISHPLVGLCLIISTVIAGCDNAAFDGQIRKAVRAKLNDPDSAKFGEELVVQSRACISLNAKNSYGGYTGSTVAQLKEIGPGNWYVETFDGAPCRNDILVKKLEIEKANEEAEKSIFAKLKNKKLIAATVRDTYSIEDVKCRTFVSDVLTYIRLANDAKNKEEEENWRVKADKKMSIIDAGFCG